MPQAWRSNRKELGVLFTYAATTRDEEQRSIWHFYEVVIFSAANSLFLHGS
jgi:hypothetical protein